jgi:hypothetical protein
MGGGGGGGPSAAQKAFEKTLDKVEGELGVAAGPWFLAAAHPTMVDLQYVSHVERMVASCLYWKGMQIRGEGAQRRVRRTTVQIIIILIIIIVLPDFITNNNTLEGHGDLNTNSNGG